MTNYNYKRRETAVSIIGQGYLGFSLAGLFSEKGDSIQPNLVLIDGNLQEMERSEIYRRIRDMNDVPMMIVTVSGQKFNQPKGVAQGTDDYVTKPVDFHELLAQLFTVLRLTGHATEEDDHGTFDDGKLEVDWRSHQVWVRGQRVKLSLTEFKILACLIKNRGYIVSHEQLLEEGWGADHNGNDCFVRLYVNYLRHKIEKDPHNPQLILTERGIGYRFSVQNKESLGEGLEYVTRSGFLTNHDEPEKPPDLVKSVNKKLT